MKSIPSWTYLPYYQKHKAEFNRAMSRVLSSGHLILGPEVEKFEKNFAKFCGARYAVGVGSGTDALFLSLKALGIGKGDSVVTVPNTAVATVSAIAATGATPVFVDVDPKTLVLDTKKLVFSKKIRCIIPVHLYGKYCKIPNLDIPVLEDFAQATGVAKVTGDIAAFSFYPTKIIGAYGDGGMIVTNDKNLYEKVLLLRQYGWKKRYFSEIQGYNSRLDELQAAILSVQLHDIKNIIQERQKLAKRYTEGLKNTPLVLPDPKNHVFHLYVVRHPKRDRLMQFLKRNKIDTNIHYPVPIHLMPAYRYLGYEKGDFPVAERASREVLSLPFYPGLTKQDQDRVIAAIIEFFR